MKIYKVSDNRTLLDMLMRPKMATLFFEDEGDARNYMSLLPHSPKMTTIEVEQMPNDVFQKGSVHM